MIFKSTLIFLIQALISLLFVLPLFAQTEQQQNEPVIVQDNQSKHSSKVDKWIVVLDDPRSERSKEWSGGIG